MRNTLIILYFSTKRYNMYKNNYVTFLHVESIETVNSTGLPIPEICPKGKMVDETFVEKSMFLKKGY